MKGGAGPPILRADPRARRRVLALATASLLLLAGLIAWLPEVQQWVTADPARGVRRLNALIATLFMVWGIFFCMISIGFG